MTDGPGWARHGPRTALWEWPRSSQSGGLHSGTIAEVSGRKVGGRRRTGRRRGGGADRGRGGGDGGWLRQAAPGCARLGRELGEGRNLSLGVRYLSGSAVDHTRVDTALHSTVRGTWS